MGLLSRMTTVVKADAHGVVDSIEDRSLLLKQHLREAEEELQRKKSRLTALGLEEKERREALRRLSGEIKKLDEDISLALSGDKAELARFAIKKMLGLKRRAEQLELRSKQIREDRDDLEKQVSTQEEAFEELQGKVKAYLARARLGEEEQPFVEPVVEDEEVEIELLRRERELSGKEGA